MGQVFLPPRSGTNKLTLEGYPAIVFQHENDHLDGILYTSKMYKPEEIPDLKPLYTIPEDNEENTDEE